jgi:hypothetical protein
MSKMAQRVDSSRFNFIALKDFFKDSLELDAEYILLQIFEVNLFFSVPLSLILTTYLLGNSKANQA